MKKCLLLSVLVLAVTLSAGAIPKPKKGKGSVVIKFIVNLESSFYHVKKGAYRDSVELIIRNVNTKDKYSAYTKNDHIVFLNLEPGTYVFSYWKIERSGTRLTGNFGDKKFRITIRPDTLVVYGYVRHDYAFKEPQQYSGGWSGKIEALKKETKVKNSEKNRQKIIDYFFDNLDKRKKWKDVEIR